MAEKTRKARRTAYRGISPKAVALYREAQICTDHRQVCELVGEIHQELGLPDFEHSQTWPQEKAWSLLATPPE